MVAIDAEDSQLLRQSNTPEAWENNQAIGLLPKTRFYEEPKRKSSAQDDRVELKPSAAIRRELITCTLSALRLNFEKITLLNSTLQTDLVSYE